MLPELRLFEAVDNTPVVGVLVGTGHLVDTGMGTET